MSKPFVSIAYHFIIFALILIHLHISITPAIQLCFRQPWHWHFGDYWYLSLRLWALNP